MPLRNRPSREVLGRESQGARFLGGEVNPISQNDLNRLPVEGVEDMALEARRMEGRRYLPTPHRPFPGVFTLEGPDETSAPRDGAGPSASRSRVQATRVLWYPS